MVVRRAHGAQGGGGLTPLEPLDGVQAGPGRQHGGVPGVGRRPGVGLDLPAAGVGHPFQDVQVTGWMDPLQLLCRGRAGLDMHDGVAQPRCIDAVEHALRLSGR